MKIKISCSPTENLCGSCFKEFVFLQGELAVHKCWAKIWKNTGCIQYMSTSRLPAEVSNFSAFFVVGSINFKSDSGCRGLFYLWNVTAIYKAVYSKLLIMPEALGTILNHVQELCIQTISLNEVSPACLTSPSVLVLVSLAWLPVFSENRTDSMFFLQIHVRQVEACGKCNLSPHLVLNIA